MKINDVLKKIAILEKKVDALESRINLNNSSDLRNKKWDEFQTIIRLQQKNKIRKSFN